MSVGSGENRYFVLRPQSGAELPDAFARAEAAGQVLTLLPPQTPAADAILLRQLPPNPPPEAKLVLFTSGSTGTPRAVFHSAASLAASGAQLARAFPGESGVLCLLAPWGMAGVAFHYLLPCFGVRPAVLLPPGPVRDWIPSLPELTRGVGLVALNPILLEFALAAIPMGSVKLVSLTAPLRPHQRAVTGLQEIYGMTEAAGPVLLDGRSLGAELRRSDSGELELRGPQLCLGFGVEGRFEPRAAAEWFATGDLFTENAGEFRFFARERELIDVGGRKIAPALIEELFGALPEVGDCVAFGYEANGTERPALLYVRRPGVALGEAELREKIGEWARTSISMDMRPFVWRETDSLPRLPNGKLDRRGARKLIGAT